MEEPGVTRNPVARLTKPAYESEEMVPFTVPEARRFVAAILDDPWEALYLVAIFTGMREGEMFALQLADLDLDHGWAYVRRSVGGAKAKKALKGTKNKASRRAVPLPPPVVEALRAHRKRVIAQKIETLNVFSNEDGGAPSRHNWPRRYFHPLLKRAGLPRIKVHDLRHSFVTLLIAFGVQPEVIQGLGGWSDIRTLMTLRACVPDDGRSRFAGPNEPKIPEGCIRTAALDEQAAAAIP
jgi:integrase